MEKTKWFPKKFIALFISIRQMMIFGKKGQRDRFAPFYKSILFLHIFIRKNGITHVAKNKCRFMLFITHLTFAKMTSLKYTLLHNLFLEKEAHINLNIKTVRWIKYFNDLCACFVAFKLMNKITQCNC